MGDFEIQAGELSYCCGDETDVVIPDGVTKIYGSYDGPYDHMGLTHSDPFYCYNADFSNDYLRMYSVFPIPDRVKSLTLPDGVTEIGYGAFFHCSSIECIALPSSLEEIGYHAFTLCSNLKNVTIPNRVARIAEWAFSHCASLKTVYISESVEYIAKRAFFRCSDLTDVVILNRDTAIFPEAFDGCPKLIFHAPEGSKAQAYAKAHNIPFEAL